MQALVTMVSRGAILTIIRSIWAFKGMISILLLIGSILGYIGAEMIEHRRVMLTEFNTSLAAINTTEDRFRKAGELAFAGPSQAGNSMTIEQVVHLEEVVRALRDALLGSLAPNSVIEETRAAYVSSLTDLQGRLNLFSPGVEGTEAVLEGLILVQPPADAYHEAANNFQTSVWTSFWAAF